MDNDSAFPTPAPPVHERSRFVPYLAVGVLSFAVDFGLLLFLRQVAHEPLWLAGTAGYWTSIVVNYGLNRMVSFRGRVVGRASFLRYGALLAVNWLTTVLLLDLAQSLGISYLVGKILAVGVLAVVNFVLYSRWVFAD